MASGGSGLIRWMSSGGSGLIRAMAFYGSGLVGGGMTSGGSDLI